VIEIVAYDPAWPERFNELGGAMRGALGGVALRIDHIGSTAVPGLAAKPVVDVQISVASLDAVDAFRGPPESPGYVFRSTNTEWSQALLPRAAHRAANPRSRVGSPRPGSGPVQVATARGTATRLRRLGSSRHRGNAGRSSRVPSDMSSRSDAVTKQQASCDARSELAAAVKVEGRRRVSEGKIFDSRSEAWSLAGHSRDRTGVK